MWTRTDFATLTTKASVRMTSVSLLSLATGATLSYFVSKKLLETKYEKISKQEIAEAKLFYKRLHKTEEEFLTPEQVLEARHGKEAVDALRQYQGITKAPVDAPVEDLIGAVEGVVEETRNVFVDAVPRDDFDYVSELANRSENRPYVLSDDEYHQGDKEYEQVSLTYYKMDGVLADERDSEVPDSDAVVGDENLLKFGYGSKDNKIVYIRNDRLTMDIEVVLSTGSYKVEVLGFELEHSDDRRQISKRRDTIKRQNSENRKYGRDDG